MEKELYVELTEEYDIDGAFVKREINGESMPFDIYPVISLLGENINFITDKRTKRFVTRRGDNQRYSFKITVDNSK